MCLDDDLWFNIPFLFVLRNLQSHTLHRATYLSFASGLSHSLNSGSFSHSVLNAWLYHGFLFFLGGVLYPRVLGMGFSGSLLSLELIVNERNQTRNCGRMSSR